MIFSSYKDILCFSLSNVSAGINFACAPIPFTVGFTVGVGVGLCLGLKRRISLIVIHYNEKIANKAQETLKPLNDQFAGMRESKAGAAVANAADKAKPLVKLCLFLSGYQGIFANILSYLCGFKEQRENVQRKLNAVPGLKGTALSLVALSINMGYITSPIFSKLRLLAGCPAGYAAGLYVMNADWRLLRTQ